VERSTRRHFLVAAGFIGAGALSYLLSRRISGRRAPPTNSPESEASVRFEWRPFLEQYSKELLATDDERIKIPREARTSKWMGFDPADETKIEATERRLGRRLPLSLRTFYAVTNGWRATGFFIWDVLPVEKIGWLRDRDRDLYQIANEAEAMAGPFKEDPDGTRLREYRHEQGTRVKRALIVTSVGDSSRWLLDPGDEPHQQEWPGGRWASFNPGMNWTANSFADLMQREFQGFLQLRDQ
jgi:hypothetical protein